MMFFIAVFMRFLPACAIAAIALFLWPGHLSAAPTSSGRGLHGEALTGDQMKALMVSRGRIEYPIQARRAGIAGSGVFEMRINPKTGRVKGVRVVQSTGSQMLDWAAARGFNRFRFQSGAIVAARAPVTFSLRRF